jgi:hypothetical protein
MGWRTEKTGLIPGRHKKFFSSVQHQKWPWGPPISYEMNATGAFLVGKMARV